MDYLLEAVGGLITLGLSALGWQISTIKRDIKELQSSKTDSTAFHEARGEIKVALKDLYENKVDSVTFQDIKEDLKLIIKDLTEIKMEHSRWQGRREKIEQTKLGNTSVDL